MGSACFTGFARDYTLRYPFYQTDSQGRIRAADCTAVAQRLTELRSRINTNNSSR